MERVQANTIVRRCPVAEVSFAGCRRPSCRVCDMACQECLKPRAEALLPITSGVQTGRVHGKLEIVANRRVG